jgi:hypothetical protein
VDAFFRGSFLLKFLGTGILADLHFLQILCGATITLGYFAKGLLLNPFVGIICLNLFQA